MSLLVIGARKKSVGHMVAKMWDDMFNEHAVTAGISGDEDLSLNLNDYEDIVRVIGEVKPTKIVCTVGINWQRNDGDPFDDWMLAHMETNVVLPMRVLEAWFENGTPPRNAHFVAISSNSAHIPRSSSMAYCASKAALSMALRCAARDIGKAEVAMSVYGYEPGLVKGTPMTEDLGLPPGVPPTRMLGLPEGMPRRALAGQIVNNLAFGGPELNGVLMRLDAGEI